MPGPPYSAPLKAQAQAQAQAQAPPVRVNPRRWRVSAMRLV